jgi:hypothetical protein
VLLADMDVGFRTSFAVGDEVTRLKCFRSDHFI